MITIYSYFSALVAVIFLNVRNLHSFVMLISLMEGTKQYTNSFFTGNSYQTIYLKVFALSGPNWREPT